MKRLMLTISAGEWEGINHRPHHFMRRCAASGWTVIYLEPPASLIAPLKDRRFLRRWKNWLRGMRTDSKDIHVVAPPPVFPFGNKYRSINRVNQWLISRTVKKVLRQFSNEAPVDVYSFLPSAVDLLPYINSDRVIYDCVDDHAAFSGLIDAHVIYKMEQDLMARANISFATAKQLYNDRKDWSRNFHVIPNGAEYEFFAGGRDAAALPEDIAGIKHPVAGFVGGISDWVDVDLIAAVAEELKDVSFVLIGPVLTNVSCLERLGNVKLLGPRPYKILPAYVHTFDVCLIPFKINRLTESVNPIKMFEYLSAGKPVVSTPLPEVIVFKDVVMIADGRQQTVEAIKEALKQSSHTEETVRLRQHTARENSWDARWRTAFTLIEAAGKNEPSS